MHTTVLPYLKAYAALIGSIATALLAVYTSDTEVGQILTVVSVIATAVATWAVPNLDPKAAHQDESVQPPTHAPQILGKAFTGGTFSKADEDQRNGDPHRP